MAGGVAHRVYPKGTPRVVVSFSSPLHVRSRAHIRNISRACSNVCCPYQPRQTSEKPSFVRGQGGFGILTMKIIRRPIGPQLASLRRTRTRRPAATPRSRRIHWPPELRILSLLPLALRVATRLGRVCCAPTQAQSAWNPPYSWGLKTTNHIRTCEVPTQDRPDAPVGDLRYAERCLTSRL